MPPTVVLGVELWGLAEEEEEKLTGCECESTRESTSVRSNVGRGWYEDEDPWWLMRRGATTEI